MSSEAAISVRGLTKEYRLGQQKGRSALSEVLSNPFRRNGARRGEWFQALDDVSFDVAPGTALGVIGRNGAGKSTLLKVLSRITKPTAGEVVLRGRVGSLLEVGTGFHPELTGRENVFMNGAMLGMRRAEIARKFDEIVAFAEVERFIDTPVKRYSSGMYVRLAFAVAAHLEPEILLVDEVLAVGDVAFQKKCLGKMGEVAGEGRTVLFVSHNTAAIQQLTSECLVLQAGVMVEMAPTRMAVETYLTAGEPDGSNEFDANTVPRSDPAYGSDARLRRIVLLHPEPGGSVADMTMDIDFEVTEAARAGFRIALTVFRFDTVPLGTMFTEDLPFPGAGVHQMRLLLPSLPLVPGRYYFGVGISRIAGLAGTVGFDAIAESVHFEIEHAAGGNAFVEPWSSNWGSVHLPCPQVLRFAAART